jgi:cobalt-zinc-cadmium efflux system outer membrane protein
MEFDMRLRWKLARRSRCVLVAVAALMIVGSMQASAQVSGSAVDKTIPRRLTLEKAEELLLQKNLTVLALKYQIDANRAAKLIAAYKPNPVLTIGAEQMALNSSLWSNLAHTDPNLAAQSTYTVRVDKIIERGRKRELRTELADFQLKASEAQMLDAIRTQTLQLKQAFTQASLARENLRLAEETEQQYQQTVKLTTAKVENGDLPGMDIYRARAGQLQYEQAVLAAHTTYEQATREILNLLGATPADVSSGQVADNRESARILRASYSTGGPDDQPTPASLRDAPLDIVGGFDDRPLPQTLEELRLAAIDQRPDVLAARNTLEAMKRGVDLARAQRTRDLSIGTEYQRVGSDNTLGASVSIPILLYNNQRAGIAQAQSQQRSAEAQLEQAKLQATTDVEKAYQAHQASRRALNLYGAQNLSQLEKLRVIASLSFKEGASSLFELLDAQRAYNAALTAFNQTKADYQNSIWQLEAAIGGPVH